jgi:uncharacterized iron-regulated membrane protein
MTEHEGKSMSRPSTPPKPRNWLLAKSRQWHLWGGLFAGLFIIVVATSGIVLNYKRPVFAALGLETDFGRNAREERPAGKSPVAQLTTATDTTQGAARAMEQALALARTQWGDARLERIEVREERGELICKVKERGGDELWFNAATGTHFIKGEYERVGKSVAGGVPVKQFDWGKVLLDLHTGKIGGEIGKVIMSLAALMLLFLTASGVYLWAKPLLIRRRNARAKQSPAAGAPAPVPVAPAFSPEPAHATLAAASLSETR